MLTERSKDKLQKRQMDTLSAKYLHIWGLAHVRAWILATDILSFCVPALYFPVRYLAKGTGYQKTIESVYEVLAGVLLAMALWRLLAKWQDKAEAHSRLRDNNIGMFTEASKLLDDNNASADAVDQFIIRCDNLEGADRELLGDPKIEEKQKAYRQSMKDVVPNSVNVFCPVCGGSPYKFKKGSCQTCGNTPVSPSKEKGK